MHVHAGAEEAQGSHVPLNILKLLLLGNVFCFLSTGGEHHEHKQDCILMLNRAKKASNKMPRGFVCLQVREGIKSGI